MTTMIRVLFTVGEWRSLIVVMLGFNKKFKTEKLKGKVRSNSSILHTVRIKKENSPNWPLSGVGCFITWSSSGKRMESKRLKKSLRLLSVNWPDCIVLIMLWKWILLLAKWYKRPKLILFKWKEDSVVVLTDFK